MYFLKPGIKEDPVRRWHLPDRIFFGHGACHILSGVFLSVAGDDAFYAEWVTPMREYAGAHVFVTDGTMAFDYHGFSRRDALIAHHQKKWRTRYEDWDADIQTVDFNLLDTLALNERGMRGADQFLHDPIPRALRFIQAYDVSARRPKRVLG